MTSHDCRFALPLVVAALIAGAPAAEACARNSQLRIENTTGIRIATIEVAQPRAPGTPSSPHLPSVTDAGVTGGLAPGASAVVGIPCRGEWEIRAVFADGRIAAQIVRGGDQVLRLR